MASPLKSTKQTVKLAEPVRKSKIRRDPPPPVKKIEVKDPEDRDTQTVVVGVVTFAVALFIVMLGISAYQDASPRHYTIEINHL